MLKITMSRRDDILKRKQAYDDAYSKREQEYNQYRDDMQFVLNNLVDIIKSKIGDTLLDLNVYVNMVFGGGIEATVNNGDNPHDDQALNWRWSVVLTRDGEVKKDSGSWSGLSAVTPEQINNLKESVRILEILNSIDWGHVLQVELPKYEDYMKTEIPEHENFEDQLFEEDLQDAIADGKLIKGHGYRYYNRNATVFYHVINESPTQYTVEEIHEDYVSDQARWPDSYRIKKDTFKTLLDKPIKTVEV